MKDFCASHTEIVLRPRERERENRYVSTIMFNFTTKCATVCVCVRMHKISHVVEQELRRVRATPNITRVIFLPLKSRCTVSAFLTGRGIVCSYAAKLSRAGEK